MASIKQTQEELNKLEERLESLQDVVKNLNNITSIVNPSAKNELVGVDAAIKVLANDILRLKSELSNMSSSGAEIDVLSTRAYGLSEQFNKAVQSANNVIVTLKGINGIDIPTVKLFNDDDSDAYEAQIEKMKKAIQDKVNAERNAAEQSRKAVQKQANAQLELIGKIRKVAQAVNNAVNSIIRAIKSVISITFKIGETFIKIGKIIVSTISRILKLFGNLSNRVKSLFTVGKKNELDNSFHGLIGSATELRSKILLLKGALDSLFNGKAVKGAKELLSSVYSLKTIIGGEAVESTVDWANSMQKLTGLSAKSLISDMGELSGVLYGLGFNTEHVAEGSENLIMMSRYLASMGAAGGDADAVMQKILSGMKGMTASIDDLGLSVRETEMKQFLNDLKKSNSQLAGMDLNWDNLTEDARVYVRYASLIAQFTEKYDISNMVKMMDTVNGRINIMGEMIQNILTTLGQGLLQIVADFGAFIIPLLGAIQKVVNGFINTILNGINKLFSADFGSSKNSDKKDKDKNRDYANVAVGSNELSDWSKIGEDNSKATDKSAKSVDNLNKALANNDKATKKASGNLQSFDRLNNVTAKSASGLAKSLGGQTPDFSGLFSSMLGDINKMAEEANESYFDALQKKGVEAFNNLRKNLQEIAVEMTGRQDFDVGFDWGKIKQNLSSIKQHIESVIKGWGEFLITIGFKIADDLNIGKIVTDATTLLDSFTNLADVMTGVLTPAFNAFYDTGLAPIVQYIGELTDGSMLKLIETFNDWSDWFDTNDSLILGFFAALGDIVGTTFGIIKPYIDQFVKDSGDSFDNFNKQAREKLTIKMNEFIEGKDEMKADLEQNLPGAAESGSKRIRDAFGSIGSIFGSLGDIVGTLLSDFLDWAGTDGFDDLQTGLSNISDWLDEHKDEVVEFIEKLGGELYDDFKKFVDAVGDLITWAVEHPDEVITLLKGIVAIKIGSYFTDGAAAIGGFVTQALTLNSLNSVTQSLSGLAGGASAASSAAGALGGIGLGPILGVGAAVGTVAGSFVYLNNTSSDFHSVVDTTLGGISDAFDGLTASIKEAGEEGGTLDELKESFGVLAEALEPVLTVLTALAGGVITFVIEEFGSLAKMVAGVLSGAFEFLGGVIDVVVGFLTGDSELLAKGFGEMADGLWKFVSSIFQGIIDTVLNLGDGIIQTFVNLGSDIIDGFKEAWKGLKDWVHQKLDDIKKAVKGFFGGLFGIGGDDNEVTVNKNETVTTQNTGTFTPKYKDNSLLSSTQDTFYTASGGASASDGKSKVAEMNNKRAKEKQRQSDALKRKSNNLSAQANQIIANSKPKRARSIAPRASGGNVAGGELFIANEDGKAELIGKIGGKSGTNVANNQMITEAIFEAVYNAIAEALNQTRGSNGGNSNKEATVNINGFGLIDRSTLSELARILSPYLNATNKNIANTGFSI